jgi:DNA modification methylase
MQQSLTQSALPSSATAPAGVVRSHPDPRVETWAIQDLKPLGRQSRHHTAAQVKKIAASIERFGFVSPLLIDAAGSVLAGVARLAAAKSLGMTALPAVIVGHLTQEEKRAFVLADNRLAELAGWNKEALKLELADLAELELDFSLEVTGFSLPEIDAIRFGVGESDAEDDQVPDARAEVVSRLGDCWTLGAHSLLVADATSPDALDQLLGVDVVRAVFTDPPYNVVIEGNASPSRAHGEFVQASGEMSDAEFTCFLTKVTGQIARVLVDGGLAYVCMDWRHMTHVMAAAEAEGLPLLNLCVWDKGSGGMGSFYRSQHELVFVLKKGRAVHLNTIQLGKNGRNRPNVWSYEGVTGFGADKARERAMHPTVKPLALVKDALLDCTNKGDIVLDLFGGSGTTLIAAEKTGRRARLMELDPKYADVIIRRWQAMSGEEAVQEATGLTFRALSHRRPEPAPPPARVRSRLLV